MEREFWHNRWNENRIGFHEGEANALLVRHLDALALPSAARVFLPLCGKTRDIAWLLSKGYCIVGCELSETAIEQLFDELEIVPAISRLGALSHYGAHGIDIYVGDLFDLSADTLGPIDAVYDRAALVALPEAMRRRYAAHLSDIFAKSPQLLIAFDYDQTAMDGPPFSVPEAEIRTHCDAAYTITQRESVPVEGGLKGKCVAEEQIYLMTPT